MNTIEAKTILLLYRPGTSDGDDPQIAEALALAKQDAELKQWLEEHSAEQEALRDKFRQITPPAGLKEQIISEENARGKIIPRRKRFIAVAAVAAIVVSLILLAPFLLPDHAPMPDNTLAVYEKQMVRIALSGYGMDVVTNDPEQVRAYLDRNQAVADYALRPGLQKATVVGCAIEGWQNTKASMICFHTGKPLAPGAQSDLWLFVVKRASLKDAPPPGPLQFFTVNGMETAVWSEGDKVYLLGTVGDRQTIEQFL